MQPLEASPVALLTQVRASLTPAFVREAMAPHLSKYRARVLTVEVVTFCVLELLLRGLPSLRALVRRLQLGKLVSVGALRVSEGAFYQRLAALPHAAFLALLRRATHALPPASVRPEVRAWAPFATAIVAVDDTTLDALLRKADLHHRVGVDLLATLGGRLGCLLNLATGRFGAIAYDSDPGSNERHRLLPLLETLPAGALAVFDRGYFAFDLFDAVGERFLYFVTRWKDGVSYRVAHTYVATPTYRDELVWLGGPDSTEAMAWPVRRIEVHVRDGAPWVFVTNVWDPTMLRAESVVHLYAARWSIEMDHSWDSSSWEVYGVDNCACLCIRDPVARRADVTLSLADTCRRSKLRVLGRGRGVRSRGGASAYARPADEREAA